MRFLRNSAPRGSHAAPKRSTHNVALVTAVLAIALSLAGIGGVVAWFFQGDSAENVFTRGVAAPVITEDFPGPNYVVKQNVAVKPSPDSVDVYVRAAVSMLWQVERLDELGNETGVYDYVLPAPVEEVNGNANPDYSLVLDKSVHGIDSFTDHAGEGCWIKAADGYFYWSLPLKAGDKTKNLVDSCTWLSASSSFGDKRKLVCDVLAQAVQAGSHPEEAFNVAWGTSSGLKVGADGVLEVK